MWQELFSQMYKVPLMVLKRGMANPMGVFIYGIITKWYVMMMIAAIVVTFWVLKGLEQAGVLQAMEAEVRYGLAQAQAVAQNCVPKIVNLPDMWDCIQHTSAKDYVEGTDEKVLRGALQHDVTNLHNEEEAKAAAAAETAAQSGNTPSGYNSSAPRVQYDEPTSTVNPYEQPSPPDDGLIHVNPPSQ